MQLRSEVLVPLGALDRRLLQRIRSRAADVDGTPPACAGHCHRWAADRAPGFEQRDGILHRQSSPGADRRMARTQGVAQQHDVVEVPVRVLDDRVAKPGAAIGQQRMPLQVFGECRLTVGQALRLRHAVQARPAECLGRDFDQERAVRRAELVAVRDDQPVLVLPEDQRERLEQPCRPVPRQQVRPFVERRLESLAISRPDARCWRRRRPRSGRHRQTRSRRRSGGRTRGRRRPGGNDDAARSGRSIRAMRWKVLPASVTCWPWCTISMSSKTTCPDGDGIVDLRGDLANERERDVGEHQAPAVGGAFRIALVDADVVARLRRVPSGTRRTVPPARRQ